MNEQRLLLIRVDDLAIGRRFLQVVQVPPGQRQRRAQLRKEDRRRGSDARAGPCGVERNTALEFFCLSPSVEQSGL